MSQELSKRMLTVGLYPDLGPEQREVLARMVLEEWRRCA